MTKSIQERIAALKQSIINDSALLQVLEEKAANAFDPSDLVEAAAIQFSFGKGETKRTMEGHILGVRLADPNVPKSRPMIRVAVGSGFEAQILTIHPNDVTKIVTGDQEPQQ